MTITTTPKLFDAVTVDRSVFRKLLPDARWFAYGSGWVNPGDANTATVELCYEKDDGTIVVLGSVTQAGAGLVKKQLGPFDVFATAGVPAGETIPSLRLRGAKTAGANGDLANWTVWLRLLPSRG